jgi:hypothetical protein
MKQYLAFTPITLRNYGRRTVYLHCKERVQRQIKKPQRKAKGK